MRLPFLSTLSFTLTIATLAGISLGSGTPTTQQRALEPASQNVIARALELDQVAAPVPQPRAPPPPSTNAKRLAAGLPPLKPHRRHHAAIHPKRSGGSLIQQSCYLKVYNTTTSYIYGYLTSTLNSNGGFGVLSTTYDSALLVSFSYDPTNPTSMSIPVSGSGSSAYGYLGAVVTASSTSDNIGSTSNNLLFLAATLPTVGGGTPSSGVNAGTSSYRDQTGNTADYESAIWQFNPTTMQISPNWINTDQSTPTQYMRLSNDGSHQLVITGYDLYVGFTPYILSYPQVSFLCDPGPGT